MSDTFKILKMLHDDGIGATLTSTQVGEVLEKIADLEAKNRQANLDLISQGKHIDKQDYAEAMQEDVIKELERENAELREQLENKTTECRNHVEDTKRVMKVRDILRKQLERECAERDRRIAELEDAMKHIALQLKTSELSPLRLLSLIQQIVETATKGAK